MFIDSNTRISVLIKHNKNSIDAIAAIAKPLEKLKNPILRKIMASRVTIAEAVKMGGCEINDFKKALQPLGFEFENKTTSSTEGSQEHLKPSWLAELNNNSIEDFDVRAILSSDHDPLKQIIKRFKEVKADHALCIINSFIPTPLIRLLEKDGVKTYTETVNSNEYRTYFFKSLDKSTKSIEGNSKPERSGQKENSNQVVMDSKEDFDKLLVKYSKEKTIEIDVRHLEMPLPMQTILGELAVLKPDEALYVNHKRIPIYLLEELADQDFQVHVLNLGENNVKLLIFRV